MWEFNLLVTLSSDGDFRHLLRELELYGDFRKTEFRGVILGLVADPRDFFDTVRDRRSRQGFAFLDLGRAVPLDTVFTFDVHAFVERAQQTLLPYLDRLAGQSFHIRLERRGHKGQIVSPLAERALDEFLLATLEARGQSARISFDDPDAVIAIETIGDRCGVGILTRDLTRRFDFVRVD